MSNKIDILVATYNGEEYISEQLNSLLKQTYQNINIIICDDCSSDDTVTIIREFERKYSNIIVYENKQNIGYIKNYEKLITLSTGPYFMLCDQDDVWKKNKVEVSYNAIKKKNVDLVFTDLEVVDEKLNRIVPSFNRGMKLNASKIKKTSDILSRNYATGCTMLCNSSIKEKLLPFVNLNKAYIHDWYILITSSFGKGFYYLDIPTILYRQHKDNNVGYKGHKKQSIIKRIKEARKKKIEFLNSRICFSKQLNIRFTGEFNEYINYLEKIKETRYINLSFNYYYKYFKCETFKSKLMLLILFHFPIYFFSYKKSGKKKF